MKTLWQRKIITTFLVLNVAQMKKQLNVLTKKLAMQYHPDRTKGDKAKEEKFKEIQEAYEILGDKEKTCGLRSIRSRSL